MLAALLLLPEVAQLDGPPAAHAAEGGGLDVPGFHRVGEEADGRVRVLLLAQGFGTEVVEAHVFDFIAVKINHLCRQRRCFYFL